MSVMDVEGDRYTARFTGGWHKGGGLPPPAPAAAGARDEDGGQSWRRFGSRLRDGCDGSIHGRASDAIPVRQK